MILHSSLRKAAEAAEELAGALLGFSVRKSIDPLTPAGFLLITELVADYLAEAVSAAEASVVADAVAELDLDWAHLSEAATAAAIKAIHLAIANGYTTNVIPAIEGILEVQGPKVMLLTRASVIVSHKIEIVSSLSERDLIAEAAIRKSHLNFIRDSSGRRADVLSERAREIVAKGVSQGLGTKQIAKDLHDYFDDEVPRPDNYWTVVADAFVGRGRTTSQIYALDDAEVEKYEVVAVLDEVTTDICRFMDGKQFAVSVATKLLESLNGLENPEDVKYANPWVRKGKDSDGNMHLYVPHADGTNTTITKIDRSGVGTLDDKGEYSGSKSDAELAALGIPVPPYHGHCRSTIVAVIDS